MTDFPQDGPDLYWYRCTIDRVVDGDTVIASLDLGCGTWLRGERCRLYGIDAPETRRPTRELGINAKIHLAELLAPHRSELLIRTHKDDKGKWGRWLVELWTPDGTCINRQMIEDGYAVPYGE